VPEVLWWHGGFETAAAWPNVAEDQRGAREWGGSGCGWDVLLEAWAAAEVDEAAEAEAGQRAEIEDEDERKRRCFWVCMCAGVRVVRVGSVSMCILSVVVVALSSPHGEEEEGNRGNQTRARAYTHTTHNLDMHDTLAHT
jgi:hypothetical protein